MKNITVLVALGLILPLRNVSATNLPSPTLKQPDMIHRLMASNVQAPVQEKLALTINCQPTTFKDAAGNSVAVTCNQGQEDLVVTNGGGIEIEGIAVQPNGVVVICSGMGDCGKQAGVDIWSSSSSFTGAYGVAGSSYGVAGLLYASNPGVLAPQQLLATTNARISEIEAGSLQVQPGAIEYTGTIPANGPAGVQAVTDGSEAFMYGGYWVDVSAGEVSFLQTDDALASTNIAAVVQQFGGLALDFKNGGFVYHSPTSLSLGNLTFAINGPIATTSLPDGSVWTYSYGTPASRKNGAETVTWTNDTAIVGSGNATAFLPVLTLPAALASNGINIPTIFPPDPEEDSSSQLSCIQMPNANAVVGVVNTPGGAVTFEETGVSNYLGGTGNLTITEWCPSSGSTITLTKSPSSASVPVEIWGNGDVLKLTYNLNSDPPGPVGSVDFWHDLWGAWWISGTINPTTGSTTTNNAATGDPGNAPALATCSVD